MGPCPWAVPCLLSAGNALNLYTLALPASRGEAEDSSSSSSLPQMPSFSLSVEETKRVLVHKCFYPHEHASRAQVPAGFLTNQCSLIPSKPQLCSWKAPVAFYIPHIPRVTHSTPLPTPGHIGTSLTHSLTVERDHRQMPECFTMLAQQWLTSRETIAA